MIQPKDIKAISAEMRRFEERLFKLSYTLSSGVPGTHPKETGAALRASMDLTRALAEFRRA